MSRAIRWSIRYQSQNDIPCRVDIYDEGWDGEITMLTPTDNPFFYAEDDSDDLLDVIRAKTGYINIYEYEASQLTDLIPETGTSHYVVASYDGYAVFMGYMQAQSFDNVIDGYVRERQFPVTSMLGMLDDYTFNAITTPGFVTLGTLLYEVISTVNTKIDTVIVPRLDNSGVVWLDRYLNTLVASPFNPDYSQLLTSTDSIFSPITYGDFIKAVCQMFGLMVYERNAELIFRRVDHDDAYIKVSVTHLQNIGDNYDVLQSVTGSSTYELSDMVSWADDAGTESLVKPFNKIIREYEGEYHESVSFSFDRMRLASIPSGYKYFAFLRSVTPELSGSKLLTDQSINSSTYLVSKGAIPMVVAENMGDGSVGDKTKMIAVNVDSSWNSGEELFKIVFMERPTASIFTLKFAASVGDRPYSLIDTYSNTNYNLNVIVRVNGQYWDGSSWSSSEPSTPMTLMSTSGALVWRIGSESEPCPDGPVEIIFTYKPPVASGTPARLICITDVKLTEAEILWSEYKADKSRPTIIKNSNGSGIGEETVNILFSPFRDNYNKVMPGVGWNEPEYPYLMITQRRIQAVYKVANAENLFYFNRPLLPFLRDSEHVKYRLIATSFSPASDEITLTLHHSDNF